MKKLIIVLGFAAFLAFNAFATTEKVQGQVNVNMQAKIELLNSI